VLGINTALHAGAKDKFSPPEGWGGGGGGGGEGGGGGGGGGVNTEGVKIMCSVETHILCPHLTGAGFCCHIDP
jgi:hypothetical protein